MTYVECHFHLRNWSTVRESVFQAFLFKDYPVELTDQRPRILISASLLAATRAGLP